MDVCATLCRYPLFSLLSSDQMQQWVQAAQEVPVVTGATLLQAGERGRSIFLVLEGRVRVSRPTRDGREIALARYHAGEVFGEYALVPPGQNTATCRAASSGRVLQLCLNSLRRSLEPYPEVRRWTKKWLRLHALLGFLRGGAFLGFQSAPGILGLLDHFLPVRFCPGDTIQVDGVHGDRFFFIRNGLVGVTTLGQATRQLTAGDCFGATALLERKTLPLAQALSEVECLSLPRAAFLAAAVAGDLSLNFQTFSPFHAQVSKALIWVGQENAKECGLAALAMGARYHGLEGSLTQLRQQAGSLERGLSLEEMQRMAERCGLRARAVRVGLEYLSQVTLPAIAHLAMDHYVVLYTLEEGKKVVLGDPARAIVALDWNAFAQQWSRHLLLIAPAGSAEGSLPKPMCAV